MAELLRAVAERHANRDLAAVALMVWSEALRSPTLAERLRAAVLRPQTFQVGETG
ncbi:hypothetical protein OG738_03580 [Amycolatopsis sp. NBC_01488]|uniref:hypothetical protein n=1 Tax=Amycolatopsis sp. NBC_01488 TaxID=2903563 RepID=UPI002E285E17|nr:hypothetical protein [Amycolatopsis sp. NBC_01488]